MADTIEFELVSPEQLLKSEPVEMVVVPGAEGDVGILPLHSPLICAVRPGVIRIHEGADVKERIFVAGGFCEAGEERCTVLAEEAMPVADIDRSEAEARRDRARKALDEATDEEREGRERELTVAEAMVEAVAAM